MLHQTLARNIKRSSCLVENQNSWVGDEGTRKRNQLTLTGANTTAALVDVGFVTLRKRSDKVVNANGLCRGNNFVEGCVWLAERDVAADGAREQVGLLGNHDNSGAKCVVR